MNTDEAGDEAAPQVDYPHQDLTHEIIAAAYAVHQELGGGFLEKVYENALLLELSARNLETHPQSAIDVRYKGELVGTYYADLFVEGRIICEIKAVGALTAEHQAQLLHYLKATGIKVGLLINFGLQRVDVKRLVF